jgi:hypothetical protein
MQSTRRAEALAQSLHPRSTQRKIRASQTPVSPEAIRSERLEKYELRPVNSARTYYPASLVRHDRDKYQLVAGERRWRAARLAGLTEVPVFVQDFANERMLESLSSKTSNVRT